MSRWRRERQCLREGRSSFLLALYAALALALWFSRGASAQQVPGGRAVPEQIAPVLAWYYAEFSRGPAQDIAAARQAGIDALIVSQTTQLPGVPLFTSPIARAAEGTDLALTLGIETNIRYDSQAALVTELQRIVRDEVSHPRFLRFGGKPVLVFWSIPSIRTNPGQSPQAAWQSVRDQVDPGRTTFWIAEGGDPAPATGTISYLPAFDALHLYSIAWDAEPSRALASWAQRTRAAPGNKLWVATVMPGGDYADGPPPWKHRERESGAYLEKSWRGALATNPSMVIVTSLNEVNERSNIDPRPEWGDLYVDINRGFADQFRAHRGGVRPPAAGGDVGQATVNITLPLLQPTDPNAEFHWLYEIIEDGVPIGYTWSPYEVADPDGGTVTIPLRLQDLQGTLFVPASITPGYVQNHDPLVLMWSGPTREGRDFGFAGPQWTTFPVVAPQVGTRLLVFSPVVSNYAWIDVQGVGPSGPPAP